MKMHLRESRTSKFSEGICPRTPLGSKALWAFGMQIYPPVTLKYPLVQKLIETPDLYHAIENTANAVLTPSWAARLSGALIVLFPVFSVAWYLKKY